MIKKLLQLGTGLASIVLFTLVLGHFQKQSSSMQKVIQEIDRQSLESDALFYSESPKAVEAVYLMQQKTK